MVIESFMHARHLREAHKDRRLELVLKFPNDCDDVLLPLS